MKELLSLLATFLHGVIPAWVALPNLTFVMPHSAYWGGLILFPPLAMYLVYKAGQKEQAVVTNSIAYLLWLWSGFVGLHRFYLRSNIAGLVYIGLFVLILTGNNYAVEARNVKSGFDNQQKIASHMVKRHKKSLAKGRSGAKAKLVTANKKLAAIKLKADDAKLTLDRWHSLTGSVFSLILVFLLIDAMLIPILVRRCLKLEADKPRAKAFEVMARGIIKSDRDQITSPFIRFVEHISGWSGNFVAYWSVLAVFVYYYEVIARYVFNSPTNWAHESMFLMFGMQYLLSGAYALREGSHVRVDVIYERFSAQTRTRIDVVTSVVFFIFTATLIVTGYIFASDSIGVMEVSFTEWGIQYWPVKITLCIGGILLLLQGVANLMRDLIYLKTFKAA